MVSPAMADEATAWPCDEQALAFGPVPSKRLGFSLGVNTVPRKICSYNCVYCQLGRTTRLTVERKEYSRTDAIVAAVRDKLRRTSGTEYVTVIGDGEPTLASNLAEVMDGIASDWSGKTALLTNGSMLWSPDVREDAAMFDVVMPTVSAGDADVFRKLHRPHGRLSFERCVDGLRDFADEHREKVWAEVMLVRGVNDGPASLERIGALVAEIEPAEAHLTAPIRPPSVSSVQPPTGDSIALALELIPGSVDFTYPERTDMPRSSEDVVRRLVDISGTHPLRRDQAVAMFVDAGKTESEASETLESLLASSALVALERDGRTYYVRDPSGRPPQHV